MFSLFRRAKQPKSEITAASWTDDSGTVTAEFDPPHTNVWHALLDLSEKRRSKS